MQTTYSCLCVCVSLCDLRHKCGDEVLGKRSDQYPVRHRLIARARSATPSLLLHQARTPAAASAGKNLDFGSPYTRMQMLTSAVHDHDMRMELIVFALISPRRVFVCVFLFGSEDEENEGGGKF